MKIKVRRDENNIVNVVITMLYLVVFCLVRMELRVMIYVIISYNNLHYDNPKRVQVCPRWIITLKVVHFI